VSEAGRAGSSPSPDLASSPTSRHPPEAAEDRQRVFDLSEQVRDVIQHKLYENLVLRGSAFL
jgi:hypothetical protein